MIPLSVLRQYSPDLRPEDLKELGPIEYDQSQVPSVSRKHAENVRRKVYGRDLQESLARGVEYAGLVSNESNKLAKGADVLSKDTQARFKDQIEGTTNSDEIIDARRRFGSNDAYQTLGDRLDASDGKLDTVDDRVTDIYVNIKDFGVVADGMTDDTEAIQAALDSGRKLLWSDGKYRFSRVVITNENMHITFGDNVELISFGDVDSAEDASIIIKGKETSTQTLLTGETKVLAKTFSVASTAGFEVGDVIRIKNGVTGTRYEYHISMAHIESISGNNITVIEPLPFEYLMANNPTVTKIETVKNTYIDMMSSPFEKEDTGSYANHIYIEYAEKIQIDNALFIGGGGKGITINQSIGFEFNNINRRKPQNNTPGHGYGVQARLGATQGKISKVYGHDNRHGIDFASGANRIDVFDYVGFASELHTHGGNTKWIKVHNSTIFNQGFMVGNMSFYGDDYIEFINCKSINTVGVLGGFTVTNQASNIRFVDCSVIGGKNGFVINSKSKHIDLINPYMEATEEHGISTAGDYVNIVNPKWVNNTGIQFLMTGGINVTVDGMDIASRDDVQVAGINIEGDATALTILGLKMRGNFTRPIRVRGTAGIIKIDNMDMAAIATRLIDVDSTRGAEVITIQNTKRFVNLQSGNNAGFFSSAQTRGVTVKDGTYNADISIMGDTNTRLMNNEFNNSLVTVQATSNAIVANNFGQVKTGTKLPEPSDTVKVANNLLL